MRPRTPAAWLGRRIARKLTGGMIPFDDAAFDEYVERVGRELTR